MKSTGIALCVVLLVLTSTVLAQGKRPNANTETQGDQKLTTAGELPASMRLTQSSRLFFYSRTNSGNSASVEITASGGSGIRSGA
jgi:hypothetical protein